MTARTGFVLIVNLVFFSVIYALAFALRFDFRIPSDWMHLLVMTAPSVVLVKLVVFQATARCHGGWFYVTFADVVALLRAALVSLGAIVAIDHFLLPQQIPRAVVLLDCVMTILLFGAARASGRMFREHLWPTVRPRVCPPALLVGVDRRTSLLAHQINSHAELNYRICGLLATEPRETGQWSGQIRVVGHLDEVREIAAAHRVKDVLVIAGALSGRRIRWLMETCEAAGLTLKIIPPVEDLFNGDRWIPMRDLDISDLLRRSAVKLDGQAIGELISGRRVLVTGAGGSIGSEICRQVLKFNPRELVLLGRGENRIFVIEQELRSQQTSTSLRAVIGDITDAVRMRQVFEQYRPDVVLHAAAHKHVPLMEANVGEAIKNNVLGTRCLADLADAFAVQHFVLISSDKAVNPTSVMGATKHLAERYVQTLSEQSGTHFVVVRFGNVLGSAGSVVPTFQDQIRRGGPITVTDPRMTRYFMTIPEAAQLVLQASAMGRGGEIFVLDMGEPVKIVDLARDLIRLSGLPAHAIDITYSGIRPGEKLEEQLYFHDERTLPTAHPKVRLAKHRYSGVQGAAQLLNQLESAVGEPDELLRDRLREAVPEYRLCPEPPGWADGHAFRAAPLESGYQFAAGEEAVL